MFAFFSPFGSIFLGTFGPKTLLSTTFFVNSFLTNILSVKKRGGTPNNYQIRQEVIGGPFFVSVSLELAPHFQIFCDG